MADNYLENKYEEYQARKNGLGKPTVVIKKQVQTPVNKPKEKKVSDYRVFVTGGADGIGKAIVEAYTNLGCKVAFCDINNGLGRMTATDTGALFYCLDVTSRKDLEKCINDIFTLWGDIDIIINNVGISKSEDITQSDVDDFDHIIATNLRPVYITSRCLAMHRKTDEAHYGRIVNICSTRYLMSEPGWEAYAASKGAIHSLTHALAISLAEMHITVNSISPGWIQNNEYNKLTPTDHSQHPSQRVGKPEDIARACLFLTEENNDFINGENITIDGGMTKKMQYK
ncbi:MAG: SDR family oxidoreductase [Muribaculaceae bacterium]|nr:SDR family oxidoreductase [Muribaculaceae bacterium]